MSSIDRVHLYIEILQTSQSSVLFEKLWKLPLSKILICIRDKFEGWFHVWMDTLTFRFKCTCCCALHYPANRRSSSLIATPDCLDFSKLLLSSQSLCLDSVTIWICVTPQKGKSIGNWLHGISYLG